MNKQRAKEILIKYKEKSDLFNWCDEYKKYMDDNVFCLVNEEAEYMLKKSYEDSESPLSYEDIDLYYYDEEELKEAIIKDYEDLENEEEIKEFLESINLDLYHNQDNKKSRIIRLKDYLNDLDDNDLKELIQENDFLFSFNVEDYEHTREIYQWFIVSSNLAYEIEKNNGVILNSNWFGRECCGQCITLDYMFIKIYIDFLKEFFDEKELKAMGYKKE